MSLTRQLWFAVVLVMAMAFGGTLLISTAATRQLFIQQLYVKNVDNATMLALSISQMQKDPVTIELLLSAQFDAGHYRLIRLVDPAGAPLVERRNDAAVEGVPDLFIALLPMDVEPGVAHVQDGWNQYGTLTVESHTEYAYVQLWQTTLRLIGWFAAAAVIVGLVGSLLLRIILRPLKAVVEQAEAIGDRRFVSQPEPRTVEFRQLVRSMNTLSGRVQQMLAEEAGRVEQLRQQAQVDPLTGLRNRETFIASLEDALAREDLGAVGVLTLVRVQDLAELNRAIGRESADKILCRVAERLTDASGGHAARWIVARLNASDFAVMAPGELDAAAVARRLSEHADLAFDRAGIDERRAVRTGSTTYHRGESRATVLARADGALAQAEQTDAAMVTTASQDDAARGLPTDLMGWRAALDRAMQDDGVQLGRFPVKGSDGRVLHHEAPVRLKFGDQWLPAARFLAWVTRLGMMPALDRMVIEAALRRLEEQGGGVGVSVIVSAESICDPAFTPALVQRLGASPDLAKRLWLEVPEYGALRHLQEFRAFCRAIKPLGCMLGLKHAGPQVSRMGELHDLGLDYLKIEGAIVHSAREGHGHEAFLRSLCTIAHTMGMKTIAAGITQDSDQRALSGLGVDGFTGPAVSAGP
jgi:predicted signal transduction protein with EAL and GGDEF domain